MFSDKPIVNLSNNDKIHPIQNELNRIYLFLFSFGNFLMTLSIEKVFDWIFPDDEAKRVV